ncbi:MAG: hypothetical protein IKP28_02725 [Clostridia bacterium]|nr:hypothetical protein [Clostridia bacterium]
MNEKEIIKEVEDRVRKELEEKLNPNMFGYIHIFEQRKKEILEKEYGITFQTSREKNTSCNID